MKKLVAVAVLASLPSLAFAAEGLDWAYPATPKPEALDKLDVKGDEEHGVRIIRNVLDYPLRCIANNAGNDGAVVVNRVRQLKNKNEGYDADKDQYTDIIRVAIQPAIDLRGLIGPTRPGGALVIHAARVALGGNVETAGTNAPSGGIVIDSSGLVVTQTLPDGARPLPGEGTSVGSTKTSPSAPPPRGTRARVPVSLKPRIGR